MNMANYTREGKILVPIPFKEFQDGMDNGKFCKPLHKAYAVLLYYSGVRKTEARLTLRDNFSVQRDMLFWDVGPRLKHSKQTDPLAIPLENPYVDLLVKAVQDTPKGEQVFPFSDRTAYNIIRRVWKYPHLFRLTLITDYLQQGRTIPEVKSWTGLTVVALEAYVGRVAISNMARNRLRTSPN